MTQRPIKLRMWCETTQQYFYEPQQVLFCLANASAEPELYEDMVWEQFSGLLDKNNKEIYEGDIVNFDRWNSPQKELENYLCDSLKQIKWGLGQGHYPPVGFVAISIKPSDLEDGHQLNWMDARNIKIIGNIHENKELLK